MKIKDLFTSAASVLMPRTCSVCGKPLDLDEKFLCRGCLMKMPRTHYEDITFNPFEQLMAGKVPVEHCASYFFYHKADPYASILHDMKYRNMPTLGRWIAERAAREMMPSNFFQPIDAIIPVPLHYTKLASRGYNQSLYLAQGISRATGTPVVKGLKAVREHSTQTHKDAVERMFNTQGMYAASKPGGICPARLRHSAAPGCPQRQNLPLHPRSRPTRVTKNHKTIQYFNNFH